jgi:F-type H+-transporting ATPase subunit a
VASPLEQFEIHTMHPMTVGGVNAAITNSSLFMAAVVIGVTLFLTLGMRKAALVPGRWQSMSELVYEFISGMVRENAGHDARPYFPFIFTLFMFILFANLIGLVPGSFAITSHIIVTFALAVVVFLGVTLIAIIKHGFKFFTYFLPPGTPWPMAPLLILIEIISYLARPITLSVRLFANMMAGHTMLHVFAGFVVALGIFGIAPIAVSSALYGLELLVAILQAYVFTILTCLYLHDALHLH